MENKKIDLNKPFILASGDDVKIRVRQKGSISWNYHYVAHGSGTYVYCWDDGLTCKDFNVDLVIQRYGMSSNTSLKSPTKSCINW